MSIKYSCLVIGLMLSSSAQAVDADLYQRYQAYKSRQQSTQNQTLEEARSALKTGDLEVAQKHLDIARNLAYTPEAISALERQIAEEKTRREQEKLAKEKREKEEQERLAKEKKEQEEKTRLAELERDKERQAKATAKTVSVSRSDLESSLSWGYDSYDIYVPEKYEIQLKERGIFFKEYYLEATQTQPAQTHEVVVNVYFAVKLKNPTNRSVRVTYKIKAREQFSISRAADNTVETGLWALGGALAITALGSLSDKRYDPDTAKIGALVGGAYGLSRQKQNNEWFDKEKTFTATLAPNEEIYETGKFPVYQKLTNSPTLEIVNVQ